MSKSTKFFGVLLSVLLVFTSLVFAAPSAGASSFMYKDGYYFQDGTALRKKTDADLELRVGDTMSFYLNNRYKSISRNEWGTTDKSVVSLSYLGYSGQNRCDLVALKPGTCMITGFVESFVPGQQIGKNSNGFPIYSDPIYDWRVEQFHIRVVEKKSSSSGTNSGTTPAKKTTTLSTPQISKIENLSAGQRVTWGKVSGAAKYRLFIKKNGSWTKLADTTANSYTNKKASSGTKYAYTVRCVTSNGKSFTSNYNKTGKSAVFIAPPKITKLENLSAGQRVTWGKIKGAAKYRLFIKKNGSWAKLADTTATTYTNKKVSSGTKYIYTVRCISSNGKSFTSAYNTTGKATTFIAPPRITGFTNSSSGVTIKWGKVNGALKYRVFIKNSGTWKKLADTKSTSYLHKILDGKSHLYTVRCLNSSGGFSSAYNTTGWSHTAPVPPYMTLSKTSVTLYFQEAEFMQVKINGKIVDNSTLKWTSSNTAVATVTKDGVIWAEGKGTAVVTVKAPNGKTASVTVKVK